MTIYDPQVDTAIDERQRLIEENLDVADRLAEGFTRKMRHLHSSDREDMQQEARVSLIRTVDLGTPGETQEWREMRIRRNGKSCLVQLSRKRSRRDARQIPIRPSDEKHDGSRKRDQSCSEEELPVPRARSLSPSPDSNYYTEYIGDVQLLVFQQCAKHFPVRALRRLMPAFEPENKERLLDLAKHNCSSDWLDKLQQFKLKHVHVEPLLLVHGLDMDQCDAARVLGKTSAAVSKLMKYAGEKLSEVGDKKLF